MKNGPYEMVIPPKEYPGTRYRGKYAYEHHVVWWQETGEILSKGECIHHINGEKRDNLFSNLEKMSIEEHKLLHKDDRSKRMVTFQCAYCGNEFEREHRQVASKLKKQKDFYCDRSCAASHFGRGRKKVCSAGSLPVREPAC